MLDCDLAYQRRIVDDVLDELFPHLAGIAPKGAKGVGKTATASQRAQTVLIDDPVQAWLLGLTRSSA